MGKIIPLPVSRHTVFNDSSRRGIFRSTPKAFGVNGFPATTGSVPDHSCLMKGKSFGLSLTDVDRAAARSTSISLGFRFELLPRLGAGRFQSGSHVHPGSPGEPLQRRIVRV